MGPPGLVDAVALAPAELVVAAAVLVVSVFGVLLFFLKRPLMAPSVLSRPLLMPLETLLLTWSVAPCPAVVPGLVTWAWTEGIDSAASRKGRAATASNFFMVVLF